MVTEMEAYNEQRGIHFHNDPYWNTSRAQRLKKDYELYLDRYDYLQLLYRVIKDTISRAKTLYHLLIHAIKTRKGNFIDENQADLDFLEERMEKLLADVEAEAIELTFARIEWAGAARKALEGQVDTIPARLRLVEYAGETAPPEEMVSEEDNYMTYVPELNEYEGVDDAFVDDEDEEHIHRRIQYAQTAGLHLEQVDTHWLETLKPRMVKDLQVIRPGAAEISDNLQELQHVLPLLEQEIQHLQNEITQFSLRFRTEFLGSQALDQLEALRNKQKFFEDGKTTLLIIKRNLESLHEPAYKMVNDLRYSHDNQDPSFYLQWNGYYANAKIPEKVEKILSDYQEKAVEIIEKLSESLRARGLGQTT